MPHLRNLSGAHFTHVLSSLQSIQYTTGFLTYFIEFDYTPTVKNFSACFHALILYLSIHLWVYP